MESKDESAKQVVLSYIKALDSHDYSGAQTYLNNNLRIKGPAGETFGNPAEFIGMLQKYSGKYDVKKLFTDGEDVCVLYDLVTPLTTAFMCSWYQVKGGKIISIQTVFDPSRFSSATVRE